MSVILYLLLGNQRLGSSLHDYRNYYKGHMNKSKGEGGERGGKWVHLGWGEGMGEKAYNCN